MMNILLVLPAGERVRVTSERAKVPGRAMLRFSVLSLTVVAALTPREHQVRIVDENVEPLDFDVDADVVGITFMTALAPRAYEIARRFKARGKIVVGGGFHPTLCPEEAAEPFDAIVIGDAEGAWEELLRDVDTGVFQRYLHFLQRTRIDTLQLNILTPLPGTPLFQEMQRAGRVTDLDWSHYDFRHVVFRPAGMTARELQEGADWLHAQFYRLDRIVLRFLRAMLTCGPAPALLGLKLNLTYRYDNRREGITGRNPASLTDTAAKKPGTCLNQISDFGV